MLMYPSLSTLVQIVKVLGEGGFSFVYLAQDEHSGVRFHCTVYSIICAYSICHSAEAIRAQEDTVPDWFARGEGGNEGGRSLQEV